METSSVGTKKRRRRANQGVFDRPYMDRASMKGKVRKVGRSIVWRAHICGQNGRKMPGILRPRGLLVTLYQSLRASFAGGLIAAFFTANGHDNAPAAAPQGRTQS